MINELEALQELLEWMNTKNKLRGDLDIGINYAQTRIENIKKAIELESYPVFSVHEHLEFMRQARAELPESTGNDY